MDLYKKIEEDLLKGKQVVIAIDGPSASGKSTLSNELTNRFDALVFHVDDYFLPEKSKTKERVDEVGGYFHYERMEKEIFKTLHKEYIISHHFNCNTQQLEMREPFENKDVIVIEGVYSHHPKLQEYITIRVFMDVDEQEQQRRILERNGEKMLHRWNKEWIPLENRYFEYFGIREKADFIINV